MLMMSMIGKTIEECLQIFPNADDVNYREDNRGMFREVIIYFMD